MSRSISRMNAYSPLPVLATIQATNKTPIAYESHDLPTVLNRAASSNPARPLDQAFIHPAFRDYNQDSLNSTRNFSLSRERCSDVAFPASAPVIPVPGPYIATGIITRSISAQRPLPPLPAKPDDAPVPPPHVEDVNVRCRSIFHQRSRENHHRSRCRTEHRRRGSSQSRTN